LINPPPNAPRCTREGCETILCRLNPGPDCFIHSVRKPRRLSPDELMRGYPTPSAEAVAAGLRDLGVAA
jgi:hypothetical protein